MKKMKETGIIKVLSNFPNVPVSISNNFIGHTPIEVILPVGEHKVEVGRFPWQKIYYVEVFPNSIHRIFAELEKLGRNSSGD